MTAVKKQKTKMYTWKWGCLPELRIQLLDWEWNYQWTNATANRAHW